VFVNAEDIGYTGTELQPAINGDPKALALRADPRRRCAAHGPDQDAEEAATRQHTPKIAFVAPPKDYVASSGKRLRPATSTCWCARCRWASCTTP
jgi:2-methylaconitate cis-trans-isomerase PrpF